MATDTSHARTTVTLDQMQSARGARQNVDVTRLPRLILGTALGAVKSDDVAIEAVDFRAAWRRELGPAPEKSQHKGGTALWAVDLRSDAREQFPAHQWRRFQRFRLRNSVQQLAESLIAACAAECRQQFSPQAPSEI